MNEPRNRDIHLARHRSTFLSQSHNQGHPETRHPGLDKPLALQRGNTKFFDAHRRDLLQSAEGLDGDRVKELGGTLHRRLERN